MQESELLQIKQLKHELLVTSKKIKKWIYPKQQLPTKYITESRGNLVKKDANRFSESIPLQFDFEKMSHLKPRKLADINNNLTFYYNHLNKAFITLKPKYTDFQYFLTPKQKQKEPTINFNFKDKDKEKNKKNRKCVQNVEIKKGNRNSIYSTRCEIYEKLFKVPLNFNLRYAQIDQLNKTEVYSRGTRKDVRKTVKNLEERFVMPQTPQLRLNTENNFFNLKKKLLNARKRHISLVNSLLSDNIPKESKERGNLKIKENQSKRKKFSSQIKYFRPRNQSYKKSLEAYIHRDETILETIRNKGLHFDNKRELRKKCKSIINEITSELDTFNHKGMERVELQASKISTKFSVIKKNKNIEKKVLKSRIEKRISM